MINETLKVILERRSCRNYRPDPLSESDIEQIIEAALYAPSAMNQQCWHFTVIQSKEKLEKVKTIIRENLSHSGVEFLENMANHPDFVAFHNAPVIVIITADENARFVEMDCGAAAQNIALAAESIGIGSCIMTSSDFLFAEDKNGELKKELGIPDGYKHICSVTLGYKGADNPPAKPRKDGTVNYI